MIIEDMENVETVETSTVDTASTSEEQTADTHTANTDDEQNTVETKENVEPTKTFTQEQVNEFLSKRINETKARYLKRYGCKSDDDLDEKMGKVEAYDFLQQNYNELNAKYKDLNEQMIFTKNNIDPEKQADIKALFKGKELELNEENFANEFNTHPEWKVVVKGITPTIQNVSPERFSKSKPNEKDEIAELFGLDKIL